MPTEEQKRVVGDRSRPISAQLQRLTEDGLVDLVLVDGETVEFSMLDSSEVVKVIQTLATIDDASASGGAKVSYSPTADDVDTAGTFHGYFHRVDSSGFFETFPTKHAGFVITFIAK